MKLTTHQEAFCKAMALKDPNNMTQRECYIKAYNTENQADNTIDSNASELAADSKIIERIEALKAEYSDFLNYDAKECFRELEDGRQLAMTPMGEYGNIQVASVLRASELKGKLTGKFVEKKEIEMAVTGNINVNIVTGEKKPKEEKKD